MQEWEGAPPISPPPTSCVQRQHASSGLHAHLEVAPPALNLRAGVTCKWGGWEWMNPFVPCLCLCTKGAHKWGPCANQKCMPPLVCMEGGHGSGPPSSICMQRGQVN